MSPHPSFDGPRLPALVMLWGSAWSLNCAPQAEAPPPVTTLDSAGVEIVDNRAPDFSVTNAWAISPHPVLRIGADEQDSTQQLHGVFEAVRLSDGRLVIATSTAPALRWYAPDGRLLMSSGRRGRGPGEYPGGHLRLWRLPGDSVATWENSQRRLQVFTPEGRYARGLRIESVLDRHPFAIGLFSDYSLVMYPSEPLPRGTAAGQIVRGSHRFLRVGSDGSIIKELGILPGQENVDIRDPPVPGLYPFSRQPAFTVRNDLFYYGVPTHYSIEVRDTAGRLTRVIRRSGAIQPLTGEKISLFEQRIMATAPTPDRARIVRSFLDQTPYPDSIPAFGRIVVDTHGNVWVQEYSPNATMSGYPHITDSLTWSVFNAVGRWLTDVRLASGFAVHEIGADYIIGISRTAFDAEVVELYQIGKPRYTPESDRGA